MVPEIPDLSSSPVGVAPTAVELANLGWQSRQQPARLTSLTRLGDVLRFEMYPGERYVSADGHVSNRCEVWARQPVLKDAPPEEWPDPVGCERWYDFGVWFPATFPTATDTRWFTFTQWKGLRGGSPPLALEVKRRFIRVGGARCNAGLLPGWGILAPLAPGAWTRLTVGIGFSPDPAVGWVEVWVDGQLAMPRTQVWTMDIIDGRVDPTYLKQGIYRAAAWDNSPAQAIYLSPVTITAERPIGQR